MNPVLILLLLVSVVQLTSEKSAMETLTYTFKDDGIIPNSKYPLVIYKGAFTGEDMDNAMEGTFAKNNWTNSWRNGVFPYHHYHSTSHEVLGVYSGSAILHMGGEKGEKLEVNAGDVIIIPAGVGHKKISASADFHVLGAYPNGRNYDLLTGKEGERPAADKRIAAVPLPQADPVSGIKAGITKLWK